jgi:hypothetical protein
MAEWSSWRNMKARCNNPNHKYYKDYGGRGISYAPEWEDFSIFILVMGKAPIERIGNKDMPYSLDRRDYDAGYSQENCEWADKKTQAQNRRNNRRLSFMGQTIVLAKFADALGMDRTQVSRRLGKGQTTEQVAASLGFLGLTAVQIESRRVAALALMI